MWVDVSDLKIVWNDVHKMTTKELIEFTGGKVVEKRSKSPLKDCLDYLDKNIMSKHLIYEQRKEILRSLWDFEEVAEVKSKPQINKFSEEICSDLGWNKKGSLSAWLYEEKRLRDEKLKQKQEERVKFENEK